MGKDASPPSRRGREPPPVRSATKRASSTDSSVHPLEEAEDAPTPSPTPAAPAPRDEGLAGHAPQPNLPAPQRPSKEPVLDADDPEILEYRRAARKFHPEKQWNDFWGELKRACGPKGIQRIDSAKLNAWLARGGMKPPR